MANIGLDSAVATSGAGQFQADEEALSPAIERIGEIAARLSGSIDDSWRGISFLLSGIANASRTISDTLSDLRENLSRLGSEFQSWDGVDRVVSAVGALRAALESIDGGAFAEKMGKTRDAISNADGVSERLGGNMRLLGSVAMGAAAATTPLGAILGALTGIVKHATGEWAKYQQHVADVGAETDSLERYVSAVNGELTKSGWDIVNRKLSENKDITNIVTESAKLLGITQGEVQGKITNAAVAGKELRDVYMDLAGAYVGELGPAAMNYATSQLKGIQQSEEQKKAWAGLTKEQHEVIYGLASIINYNDDAKVAVSEQAKAVRDAKEEHQQLADADAQFAEAQKQCTAQADDNTRATQDNTAATEDATGPTKTYKDEMDELSNAIKNNTDRMFDHGNALMDADGKYRGLLDVMDQVANGQKGHLNEGFDVATKAGRDNMDVIDGLIRDSEGYYKALVDQGVPQDEINAKMQDYADKIGVVGGQLGGPDGAAFAQDRYNQMIGNAITATQEANEKLAEEAVARWKANGMTQEGTEALKKTMEQTGRTKEEIGRYIEKVLKIPSSVVTEAVAKGLDPTEEALNYVARQRKVYITPQFDSAGVPTFQLGRGKAVTDATGGSIWGPGTGTSDSIPAWLSNGEYVVRSVVANKWRRVLDYLNAVGNLPPSTGFARGGSVDASSVVESARLSMVDRLRASVPMSLPSLPVAVVSPSGGPGVSDTRIVSRLDALIDQGRRTDGLSGRAMVRALVDVLAPELDHEMAVC
ncbi:MAG: hypothetical protein LBV00_11395 [Propionibacteriaceae bacterium]|nr:hypothetical protein [Propionibacteriaceae bacterium]